MQQIIQKHIVEVCQRLFDQSVEVSLDIPAEQFGDFATNVALQLGKAVGDNPRAIAQKIVDEIAHEAIDKAQVAGPGFINITVSDKFLLASTQSKPAQTLEGKTVVAEYSDPNPFKVLHTGHLYTSIVGDSIANLLERAGGKVHRVNFGGDVGMHVAKTMYVILQKLGGENPDRLSVIAGNNHSQWLAEAYIAGSQLYEESEQAKTDITELNKRIYKLHHDDDHESPLAQIYWTCRQWSYDYFATFYERIGTSFERYYPESETASLGLQTVKKHIGDVFVESNGAVVFDGEKHGLHTRVFINSEGLPTYETKDVGLILKKHEDYNFDLSVVITGNEQLQYMTVVLKAVEQFAPELAQTTTHLTHGLVKLKGGVKMSSRQGNILRATDVLDEAAQANKLVSKNEDENVTLAAVKYAFLKSRLGGDIVYDPNESVSLHGNSGPYLQYAHARARSILAKTTTSKSIDPKDAFIPAERSLARKLSHYNDTLDRAIDELAPHIVCTYLYELAQEFNRFYELCHVVGDERESIRSHLVELYAETLKDGLQLLGIVAVEGM